MILEDRGFCYSYMGSDTVMYKVLFYCCAPCILCGLFCFVRLYGWEHEYNSTMTSSDTWFAQ